MSQLTFSQLKKAIIASLSDDLLKKKYLFYRTPTASGEAGHCAVASEALYYLAGGREAGFVPVVCGYDVDKNGAWHVGPSSGRPGMRRETHWWIQGPKNGKRGTGVVIDLTAAQFTSPFPYEKGRHTGFMQPQRKPSKRAQIVMDRVMKRLGQAALRKFAESNIRRFHAEANAIKAHKNRLRPF